MAEQVRAFVDKSRNPLYSNPVYLEKVVRQIVLKNLKPNQKIPEFLPEADKKRIMAKRQRDKELAAGQARLNYKLQNLRRR